MAQKYSEAVHEGRQNDPAQLKGNRDGPGRQKLTRTANNSRHQPFAALSLVGIGQSSQWLFESHHNFEGARGFTFLLGRLRCQSQAPLARAICSSNGTYRIRRVSRNPTSINRLDRWSNSDSARGNDAPDPGQSILGKGLMFRNSTADLVRFELPNEVGLFTSPWSASDRIGRRMLAGVVR
jgi:hypothetical protein